MIKMWLLGVRHWEIAKDFNYVLNGNKYVMPYFKFDGASMPKFLHPFCHQYWCTINRWTCT